MCFGPNENHKGDMRSLVNKAFDEINATGMIGLFRSYNTDYEDGEFGRDFVYVKDAVDMTLHFMESTSAGCSMSVRVRLRRGTLLLMRLLPHSVGSQIFNISICLSSSAGSISIILRLT